MESTITLPLYIKRNRYNNKNVNIIKNTLKDKLNEFGVVYGEFRLLNNKNQHFEISLISVSHVILNINTYTATVDLKILETNEGSKVQFLLENNIDLYAVIRDSDSNKNYRFFTIDIVEKITDDYKLVSCLRKEKIKRLLKK